MPMRTSTRRTLAAAVLHRESPGILPPPGRRRFNPGCPASAPRREDSSKPKVAPLPAAGLRKWTGPSTENKPEWKREKPRGCKKPEEATEQKAEKQRSPKRGNRAFKWPLMDRHFKSTAADAIPRLVVIDGCNVARSASGRGRENVNCLGLLCVVRYLVRRDVDVVIFLPVVYNNQYNFNAKNLHVLPVLNKLNILTFTPARASRGDRDAFINYDDLYVLDFAERYGGCVVSSDRFDDIRNIKEYGKYHDIIDRRRIDVRFQLGEGKEEDRIRCQYPEFFIHGDQLGKEAKSPKAAEEHLNASLFCEPANAEFLNASTRRKMWSPERKEKILATIDRLLEEMNGNENSNTHLPSMYSDPKAAKHVYKTRLYGNKKLDEEVSPKPRSKDRFYDCFDDDNLKYWREFGENGRKDAEDEVESITVINPVTMNELMRLKKRPVRNRPFPKRIFGCNYADVFSCAITAAALKGRKMSLLVNSGAYRTACSAQYIKLLRKRFKKEEKTFFFVDPLGDPFAELVTIMKKELSPVEPDIVADLFGNDLYGKRLGLRLDFGSPSAVFI